MSAERTELDEQIERERTEPTNGAAHEPDADERRRAKDRERKAKDRSAKGASPRRPRPDGTGKPETKAPPEKELDPRVVLAMNCCLESMTLTEITPDFAEKMQKALAGAIQYEIEVRLPMVADGFESEVGLSCAAIGAGVTRFRLKRQSGSKDVVVRERPPDPPGANEGGEAGGATA